MNKKGYFFLLDLIFALLILTIGYLLITTNRVEQKSEFTPAQVSENAINLLSQVKVSDLCTSSCSCSNDKLQELCLNGVIHNTDDTLLDLLGEIYYNFPPMDIDSAAELFENITFEHGIIRRDLFGVELRIQENSIYQSGTYPVGKDMISSKKIVFGFYENATTGTVTYWGPFLVEVNVWEK